MKKKISIDNRIKEDTKYYSQSKQDTFIDWLFQEQSDGFFVDIGAHNGIDFSNSYFFEKVRGWRGLCVEANPNIFKDLLKNRRCLVMNACVSNNEKADVFISLTGYTEMLSGILSSFTESHLERIEKELSLYGGEKREITLDCMKAQTLFDLNKINHIDYCSIDVEGAELNILQSIDFCKTTISAISVENSFESDDVRDFLKEHGYFLIARCGEDDIFVHNCYKLS